MNHRAQKKKISNTIITVPQVNAAPDSFVNVYHLLDKA